MPGRVFGASAGASVARILVIEEDPAVAEVLRELLEIDGSRVVLADDPDAWTGSFDLAIVSLTSPADGAIAELRRVTRERPSVKIVGIVADSRTGYDFASVDSVFRKPFDMREFLATVRRLSAQAGADSTE